MTEARISKWKVFGLTVITWLVFSVLAVLYLYAMEENPEDVRNLIFRGHPVVWSWASLIMGIVMTVRLGKKWWELLWGVIAFVVCLVPIIGTLFGVVYFGLCYWKLERKKVSMLNVET